MHVGRGSFKLTLRHIDRTTQTVNLKVSGVILGFNGWVQMTMESNPSSITKHPTKLIFINSCFGIGLPNPQRLAPEAQQP
jgi:hypothetical protein